MRTEPFLQGLWRDDSGQDLAEYGLLLLLIVVAVFSVLTAVGTSLADLWSSSSERVTEAVSGT